MRAGFSLRGKLGEGEVIKQNPLTTLIRVSFQKLDIVAMHWVIYEKIIKRHNRKHHVRSLGV